MKFNNQRWRNINAHVVQDLKHKWHGLSFISPFGFEVTRNMNHLAKTLRKFYCYVGVISATPLDIENIANEYSEKLFFYLNLDDPVFLNDVVLLIRNDRLQQLKEPNYICSSNDKLIDIQIRQTPDIFADYANCIIASINGLLEKKGESSLFDSNAVKRSRTFQLYIMFENIFEDFLEPMTITEKNLYKKTFELVNNSIQFFFNPDTMQTKPSNLETEILRELINPRLNKLITSINQSQDKVKINCVDYHVHEKISLELDIAAYQKASQFIKKTYEEFI